MCLETLHEKLLYFDDLPNYLIDAQLTEHYLYPRLTNLNKINNNCRHKTL